MAEDLWARRLKRLGPAEAKLISPHTPNESDRLFLPPHALGHYRVRKSSIAIQRPAEKRNLIVSLLRVPVAANHKALSLFGREEGKS